MEKSGILWLVLEETHRLDVVALVEREAVVDPGREHEQVSRSKLDADPLGVIDVLQ